MFYFVETKREFSQKGTTMLQYKQVICIIKVSVCVFICSFSVSTEAYRKHQIYLSIYSLIQTRVTRNQRMHQLQSRVQV